MGKTSIGGNWKMVKDGNSGGRMDERTQAAISGFANRIGIKLAFVSRTWKREFLPGILIWRGGVRVDPGRCWHDDVLHEIGHLAILPGLIRRLANFDVDKSVGPAASRYIDSHPMHLDGGYEEDPIMRALLQAGEAEAIAWSYAAMVELGLPIQMHLDATPLEIDEVIQMLGVGRHFGVNGLQAAGMTKRSDFPKMLRWVQP